MTRTILRTGLGALVVTASLALVAPFAQAAPTPSPTPSVSAAPTVEPQAKATSYNVSTTTTGTMGEKMLRAARVIQHSSGRANGHLDWSAAKDDFGSHTTWRDDFAAGYQGAGGTLDNASKSTKDRLRKRFNDEISSNARRKPIGGTNCTGVTKEVAYSRSTGRSETWFDSCDTNALIGKYLGCSTVLGYISKELKGWKAKIPGFFAIACTLKAGQLAVLKSNSSVGGLKIYYTRVARVGGSGLVDGQVYVSATTYSQ